MTFSFTYTGTKEITDLLTRIDIAKGVIDHLPSVPHIEENIRRTTLLKSSLFSARIEGNPLRLEDITAVNMERSQRDRKKQEIANIYAALRYIRSPAHRHDLSVSFLQDLHRRVLRDIGEEPGILRHEPSAIFNMAGIAVYMTPPPGEVSSLLTQAIEKMHASTHAIPIKAALFHFEFEKIHPFLDGNGRVGRIVTTHILYQGGYDFRGLVSLEEYLDRQREEYYDLLGRAEPDISPFVHFILEGIASQAEKAIEELKDHPEERIEDSLLPRRQEILAIIRDHQLVSFDFISRRFPTVTKSTLHFDISHLIRKKLIRKLGATRGVSYSPR